MVALALPPSSEPTNSQFFRPIVSGRMPPLRHVVVDAGIGIVEIVGEVGGQALVIVQRLGEVGLGQQPAGEQTTLTILVNSSRIGFSFSRRIRRRSSGLRFHATRSNMNR